MAFKTFWPLISPRLFTADGTPDGGVTLSSTLGFRVKQQVIISAAGQLAQALEIKRVISNTLLYVGPLRESPDSRTDISAYTVSAGATIMAFEQLRPAIDAKDTERATFEEEPVNGRRSYLVDDFGKSINDSNPLPVAVVGAPPTNQKLKIIFNEDPNVIQGVTADLVTYMCPSDRSAILFAVSVSGENIAKFSLLINSVIYMVKRTYFGSGFNAEFRFGISGTEGLILNPGDTVEIQVLHNRPATGTFEGTIQVIEKLNQ